MALGSSAPEILMALSETILTMHLEPEEGLGSACIVGSAAFNLLAISSVCVAAIDKGDVRRIKDYGVFVITATFSIWAYLWMYIVMKVTSPMVIDVLEATLTFLFSFLLTRIKNLADLLWTLFLTLFCT